MPDELPGAGCLSRDELLERYGQPERTDATTVLALLGKPNVQSVDAFAFQYSSVEAYEAFVTANRIRNRIAYHNILQLGPAVTDDGVFGVLLLGPVSRD